MLEGEQMRGAQVDPAALLIAVVAVGVQPVTADGPWTLINTVVSGLAFGLILCFLWPDSEIARRHLAGLCIGVSFILGVSLAFPVQWATGVSPDHAIYLALAIAGAAVGVGTYLLYKVRRRRRTVESPPAAAATVAHSAQ